MAAAVVVTPDEPSTGGEVSIAATGFLATTNLKLDIVGPDGESSFETNDASDGSGDHTWTNVTAFEQPGVAKVTVTDGTSTVHVDVEVFA